jgi:hypothetical protein
VSPARYPHPAYCLLNRPKNLAFYHRTKRNNGSVYAVRRCFTRNTAHPRFGSLLPDYRLLGKILPCTGRFWFIGAWCNGSTPDFGSVDLGSNPGAPASITQTVTLMQQWALCEADIPRIQRQNSPSGAGVTLKAVWC